MHNNYLYHHGIKGQKWGVRRFQNEDGSLTTVGRARRTSDMSNEELAEVVRRRNLENQYDRATGNDIDRTKVKMEKTKKILDASSNVINQTKSALSKSSNSIPKVDLSKMTDKQMRDIINRFNLEQQYLSVITKQNPQQISKGQQYLNNILDVSGSALAIGGSALGIALAIKELKG